MSKPPETPAIIEARESGRWETRAFHRDINGVWQLLSGTPWTDPKGYHTHSVEVVRDSILSLGLSEEAVETVLEHADLPGVAFLITTNEMGSALTLHRPRGEAAPPDPLGVVYRLGQEAAIEAILFIERLQNLRHNKDN